MLLKALFLHAEFVWPAIMSALDPEWSKLFTSWDRTEIKECLRRPAPSPLPKGGPLDRLLKATCQLLPQSKQSPLEILARVSAKAVPCHCVQLLATIQHWLQKTPNQELLQPMSHWWTVTHGLGLLVYGSMGGPSQLTRSCWKQITQPEGKHLALYHHCHLPPTVIVLHISICCPRACGDLTRSFSHPKITIKAILGRESHPSWPCNNG